MEAAIEKIQQLLEPLLADTDMFIINIRVKPTNNFKIFLDADEGLSIEKSAAINRKLYHIIEAEQLYPDGNYSLEVSSPGVDEPLSQLRQYKKNIGRTILVTPVAEGPEKTGVLKEVDEQKIIIEEKIGKKKEIQLSEIPFTDIKTTVVQIIF